MLMRPALLRLYISMMAEGLDGVGDPGPVGYVQGRLWCE